MPNYKIAISSIMLSIIFLHGCAVNGNKKDDLASEFINPSPDQALMYIIRAPRYRGIAGYIPFYLNHQEIGKLWSDQYLYFFVKPLNLTLPSSDGSARTIHIKANKKYYLLYGYEMDALDAFIHPSDFWSENKHYKIMSNDEGKILINSYGLSGDFRRIIISSNGKINLGNGTTKNHAPLITHTNLYMKAKLIKDR